VQELIIFQLKILWRIACVFDFSITIWIFSTQRQFYRKKEKEEERGKKNHMSRIFIACRFFFREPKLHSGCRGFANRTGNLGNVDIFLGRGVKRKRYESFGEKLSCGATKTNRTGLELQQFYLEGARKHFIRTSRNRRLDWQLTQRIAAKASSVRMNLTFDVVFINKLDADVK